MNIESIIANPWVGFIGTLLGIVGIVVSLVLYFRTRKFQLPACHKSSIRWYDGNQVPHADVRLTFQGRVIPRFSITHMAFWNAGNQTIRKSDFVSASPLRLKIPPNTEVFDIRVLSSTAPEIGASIASPVSFPPGAFSEIPVHFEYLDPDDGFSIQIIHDAASPDEFEFVGKLPGVREFRSTARSQQTLQPYGAVLLHPHNPTSLKFFLASISIALGSIGVWSIYSAIFEEFHWYQLLGGAMVIYFGLPFLVLSHPTMPTALHRDMSDAAKSTD